MRDDEDIKVDIAEQLNWDARIDASEVSITVNNGDVTLSGHVPTMAAKSAAFDNAYLVEGVLSVTDDLKVEIPETKVTPADVEIRDNVEMALSINSVVDTEKIDISVNQGWVSLEGTVNAFWKKINVEREALDVNGVLGVSNNIAVVPTDSYEDEKIAREINNALERNIQVNADDITVRVENGAVTLDGTVKTNNAKSTAYDAAQYTSGVTSVKNRVRVGSLITDR